MKNLEKDELYKNLQSFLTSKGIELQEGSYSQKIRRSCDLLSDTINAGNEGLVRARSELDRKLQEIRQVIHEKTAPRPNTDTAGQRPSSPRESSDDKVVARKVKKAAPRKRKKATPKG